MNKDPKPTRGEPEPMTNITITIQGGMVDRIENIPPSVSITVVDLDTDGVPDWALTAVNGKPALVSTYP